MKNMNRRSFLKSTSGAMSTVFLRSLATGIPVSYLLQPSHARAQMNRSNFQTLILSTSYRGDPLNINCPGSYVNGVTNHPRLETSRARFGSSERVRAARVWCDLPRGLRNKMAFVHYSSRTAAHPEYRDTMKFKGSVKSELGNGTEMFPSAIAQMSASNGVYKQREPIPLCDSFLSFNAQPLQTVKPQSLRALFNNADQALADLRSTRDQVLDEIYGDMSLNGNKSQRDFIDQYALSREQARNLGQNLGTYLESLSSDGEDANGAGDQIIAAVALAKLEIAPVITINIPFGGDNHQDNGLINEERDTLSGVAHIADLWDKLGGLNIRNKVTFATMNVFGRRSYLNSRGGRDHNRHHSVMVAFGNQIQGGVYGGMNSNGEARNIGNINVNSSMEAAGFSLARALGHSADDTQNRIHNGQLINGFLS